ncbi:S1/P1 nuclease-domain-containing protein [Powellomyces hirtus]|nr:S1/P1 nuclease-domain-containing protein [Powellomyces hirtus]
MRLSVSLSLIAAGAVGQVAAWGGEGHKVIGSLAASLVKPATLSKIQSILKSGETLKSVGSWADQVKSQRGNGVWHYIDVNNGANPILDPTNAKGTCTPNLARDCNGVGNAACIVPVISQQGEILEGACSGSPTTQQAEAIKYLVHFVGDIVQPLHACGYMRGGNENKVARFDNQVATQYGDMQMHWIWDSSILVKNMGGKTTPKGQSVTAAQVDAYIVKMLNRIKTGDLKSKAAAWSQCNKPDAGTTERCPFEWATDSAALGCSSVYNGYDPTADLGGAYYNKYSSLVDTQIAKGGIRLAAYLDEVLACKGSGGPSTPTDPEDPEEPTPNPSETCPDAEFSNFLRIDGLYNACCTKGTNTSGKTWTYRCCTGPKNLPPYNKCGSNGDGYKRTSNNGPYPKGKPTLQRRRSI